MKVLVTGSAGFIGSQLSHKILSDGHQVVGIDNLNDYYDVNLKNARLARLTPQDGFEAREYLTVTNILWPQNRSYRYATLK